MLQNLRRRFNLVKGRNKRNACLIQDANKEVCGAMMLTMMARGVEVVTIEA